MNEHESVAVTLPAEVQQIAITPASSEEPFLVRAVDVVPGLQRPVDRSPGRRRNPEQAIDELRHAHLLPQS